MITVDAGRINKFKRKGWWGDVMLVDKLDAQKRWKDFWAAGQRLQAIRSLEPVADVVDGLALQYRAARRRIERL